MRRTTNGFSLATAVKERNRREYYRQLNDQQQEAADKIRERLRTVKVIRLVRPPVDTKSYLEQVAIHDLAIKAAGFSSFTHGDTIVYTFTP